MLTQAVVAYVLYTNPSLVAALAYGATVVAKGTAVAVSAVADATSAAWTWWAGPGPGPGTQQGDPSSAPSQ